MTRMNRTKIAAAVFIFISSSFGNSMNESAQVTENVRGYNHTKPIEIEGGETADEIRLKARIYPKTFQIGENAEIHLSFAKAEKIEIDIDAIEVCISLKQKSGWFVTTSSGAVALKKILSEGYIWKADFSFPNIGSDPSYPSPGPVDLIISIVLKQSSLSRYGESYLPLKTIHCPIVHLELLAGSFRRMPQNRH